MRTFRRWPTIGAAGLGLLGAPCVRLMVDRPAPLPLPVLLLPSCSARGTPSMKALHESAYWRTEAVQSAAGIYDEERGRLLRRGPQAPPALAERRRPLLAAPASRILRPAPPPAAR